MTSSLQLLVVCVVLFLLQGAAALPWVLALGQRPFRTQGTVVFGMFGILAVLGAVLGVYLDFNSDPGVLSGWGRLYMAVLQLQLGVDVFVVAFVLLLTLWSKGGAVALAAFQEGVRQPMFWLLAGAGALVMGVSVYIPYFTFGEDFKMVKELCYALTMLAPVLFGIILGSTSVSEEIEGRTAVTLLSKPISRRQFLLGKFTGITLAAGFMTLLLGWVLIWIVLYKQAYEANMPGQAEAAPEARWPLEYASRIFPASSAGDLLRGIFLWCHDFDMAAPGLLTGFCQVVVLVAVAVALATRLPVALNLSMCFLVYFLGHLTPVMTEVTRHSFALVRFVAQLFDTILPSLDLFDVGSAVIRDLPLDPNRYAVYTLNVALYALTYTAIALLAGLILFEDRDVA